MISAAAADTDAGSIRWRRTSCAPGRSTTIRCDRYRVRGRRRRLLPKPRSSRRRVGPATGLPEKLRDLLECGRAGEVPGIAAAVVQSVVVKVVSCVRYAHDDAGRGRLSQGPRQQRFHLVDAPNTLPS